MVTNGRTTVNAAVAKVQVFNKRSKLATQLNSKKLIQSTSVGTY